MGPGEQVTKSCIMDAEREPEQCLDLPVVTGRAGGGLEFIPRGVDGRRIGETGLPALLVEEESRRVQPRHATESPPFVAESELLSHTPPSRHFWADSPVTVEVAGDHALRDDMDGASRIGSLARDEGSSADTKNQTPVRCDDRGSHTDLGHTRQSSNVFDADGMRVPVLAESSRCMRPHVAVEIRGGRKEVEVGPLGVTELVDATSATRFVSFEADAGADKVDAGVVGECDALASGSIHHRWKPFSAELRKVWGARSWRAFGELIAHGLGPWCAMRTRRYDDYVGDSHPANRDRAPAPRGAIEPGEDDRFTSMSDLSPQGDHRDESRSEDGDYRTERGHDQLALVGSVSSSGIPIDGRPDKSSTYGEKRYRPHHDVVPPECGANAVES